MDVCQSERQDRCGDRVDFFGGGKRQNPLNLELNRIDFGNCDLALGSIGNVLIPVGKLKGEAVISSGEGQHAFVSEGFILNILIATLVEGIVQILLRDEDQFIGIAIKNLHADLEVVHQAVILGRGDAEVTGRLEAEGIIEAGNAALIANGQEDDIQIMTLKNHAGADLFAVHPLAADVIAIARLLGKASEHHEHDVGSKAGPGI